MTDSFVLQTLQSVRAAINAVQAARITPGLSDDEQSVLTKAFFALDDLQDDLINQDLASEIDAINADAKALQATVTSLQGAATQIKTVVDAVNTVAQVVGALAQVVAMIAKFA